MSKKDYASLAMEAHRKHRGKISVEPKFELNTKEDLSIAYTPGVAEPCKVDAVPIVLSSQDTEEIIRAVELIAPTFGGINLEDIAAPRCFEIERRLKESLDIPVFHDDQHGTAIVTLAGMINACRITNRELKNLRVVINGAGAAGVSIAYLLFEAGVEEVMMCDSKGIIHKDRDDLNPVKQEISKITNKKNQTGGLEDAVRDADVFIGVSAPGVLTKEMVETMRNEPIIFAMANPTPEIMPDEAKDAGARVVATGRSDFPNQINNVLAFPGLFRGALDARISNLTTKMFIKAAEAIADCVEEPDEEQIIPSPFDERVPEVVAEAIRNYSD
jgi:malate dehydrogenase (oxaloacetate-decarboxylating)